VRGFGCFRKSLQLIALQRFAYDLQYAIDVLSNVVVPEAKYKVTHRLQDLCSLLVVLRASSMLSAVEFDNEMGISAEEIDDETIDRELPSEFPATEAAIAQPKPQNPFGVCLVAA
jgi:hypothetical protein